MSTKHPDTHGMPFSPEPPYPEGTLFTPFEEINPQLEVQKDRLDVGVDIGSLSVATETVSTPEMQSRYGLDFYPTEDFIYAHRQIETDEGIINQNGIFSTNGHLVVDFGVEARKSKGRLIVDRHETTDGNYLIRKGHCVYVAGRYPQGRIGVTIPGKEAYRTKIRDESTKRSRDIQANEQPLTLARLIPALIDIREQLAVYRALDRKAYGATLTELKKEEHDLASKIIKNHKTVPLKNK